MKDLKRQLKLERKRAEQLQQTLQEALTENRVKPGALVNLFYAYDWSAAVLYAYTFKTKVARLIAIIICKEAACKRLEIQATLSKSYHK